MPVDWIQTATGRQYPLLAAQPKHIHLLDIAEGLAKQSRFNGHTNSFYSVAQHSVFVMDLLPDELKPYGLLHDAHEAYLGDIPSPIKYVLEQKNAIGPWNRMRKIADAAIFQAFGLEPKIPKDAVDLIHHADRVALATEKRDLMLPRQWPISLPDPTAKIIRPWPWPKALEEFTAAFQICCELHPAMTRAVTQHNTLYNQPEWSTK